MELILTAEEHELLLSILEQRHRDLLREIWHTDSRQYKALLRRQEQLVESMVARLQTAPLRQAC
ncbi:MAG: hypothetical protein ACLQLC_01400 [Candidatus Sulfotelmatobacter sp.]